MYRYVALFTAGLLLIFELLGSGVFAQQSRGAGNVKTQTSEKRLALVIGNGGYRKTEALANPVNDANDVAATLKDLGFEVISGTNQTKSQMQSLIRQFGVRLADTKAVGLFFYAGHGIAQGGTNYLLPVDADIQAEDEIEDGSISINFLLDKMEAANNGFNMVILDACRNNPFSRKWHNYRDIGGSGGLTRIDAPTGTLIAYATKPGDVASDGTGRNGLYTSALLKQMRVKNVEMGKMFQRVRADVVKQSKGKQVPFDESSVVGDFYFAGTENVNPIVERNTNTAIEKELWDSIKNSTDADDFKFYKEKYPSGIYANLADLKIKQLTRSSVVLSKNQPPVKPNIPNTSTAASVWANLSKAAKNLLKYEWVSSFSEGLARVRIGGHPTDKYGFIDKTGKEITPLKYDGVYPFSEGLAVVRIGEYERSKYGFIDKTGKEIIPLKYDSAISFSEGFGIIGDGDKVVYIDKTGKKIIPFKYRIVGSFSEGLAPFGTKWSTALGFIDKTGKEIIPAKYFRVESFSEGLAAVRDYAYQWGFIDKTGKEIIPFKYVLANSFSEGLAAVNDGGKWGFIDKTGKEIIPFKYNYVYSFSKGLASVKIGDDKTGLGIINKTDKWGIIDKTGKEVVSVIYDEIWCDAFREEGFIGVISNGRKGFVDLYGNEYFDF